MSVDNFTARGTITPINNYVFPDPPGLPAFRINFPSPPPSLDNRVPDVIEIYIGPFLAVTQIIMGNHGGITIRGDSITSNSGYETSIRLTLDGLGKTVTIIDSVRQITYSFETRSSPEIQNASVSIGVITITTPSDVTPLPETPALNSSGTLSVSFGKTITMKSNKKRNDFSPMITISAATSARGKNFGEAYYTVLDSKPHTGTVTCKSKKVSNGVWESVFSDFTQINSILKGRGCTLVQKFTSLIDHYDLKISVEGFTAKMAFYAYSKLILSKLMYDDFDAKYLSRCFNEQFMRDLEASDYSEFAIIFAPRYGVSNFDRYFKCVCDTGKC